VAPMLGVVSHGYVPPASWSRPVGPRDANRRLACDVWGVRDGQETRTACGRTAARPHGAEILRLTSRWPADAMTRLFAPRLRTSPSRVIRVGRSSRKPAPSRSTSGRASDPELDGARATGCEREDRGWVGALCAAVLGKVRQMDPVNDQGNSSVERIVRGQAAQRSH
jgi:hypothetical protein